MVDYRKNIEAEFEQVENKILSIHSDGITSEKVIQMLDKVGFKAEKINS